MFLTETLIACAVAVVAALAVARFRPQDRATLWSTLLVALAGLLSLGAAQAADWARLPIVAQVLHEAGVIALGIALIRLLSLLAFRVLFPRLGVQAPRIAEDIVATIGYVAWAVVRLRVAGVDFAGIVTASAVITAVIAFSMQDTLGNILGGIALQLDESLQIGDWIKVDELSGRVTEVRWRSTSVATRNGEIVVLPNSVLMKNRFLVLGRRDDGPPQWRRWIRFEAPGDVPPARVIDAVGEELRSAAIAGVAADPAPDCLLMGLDGGL